MRLRFKKEEAEYMIEALKMQRGYTKICHEQIEELSPKEQEEEWQLDAEEETMVQKLITKLKGIK